MALTLTNLEGLVWNKMLGGLSFGAACATVSRESNVPKRYSDPEALHKSLAPRIRKRTRQQRNSNYVKSLDRDQRYWLYWAANKTRELMREEGLRSNASDAARKALKAMKNERRARGYKDTNPAPQERVEFAVSLICSLLGKRENKKKRGQRKKSRPKKPEQKRLDLSDRASGGVSP